MSRPTLADVASGSNTWDTTIDSNNDKLTAGPLPVMEYADFASLPAAGLYDRCVAATITPPMLWLSNGAAWLPLYPGLMVATTLLSGLTGASATWTGAFPAKVRRIGVAGRVTTAATFSGGGNTINVGNHAAADPDRYAAAVAKTLGTTFEDAATADPGGWDATAQDVVLTPDAGAFTAGAVRLFAFYLVTKAPTS
jgi:hypothetical protein